MFVRNPSLWNAGASLVVASRAAAKGLPKNNIYKKVAPMGVGAMAIDSAFGKSSCTNWPTNCGCLFPFVICHGDKQVEQD